eukprot:312604_1
MEELIRFRLLAEDLTNKELSLLMDKLCHLNRNFLLKCIFLHFAQKLSKTKTLGVYKSQIEEINHILSEIHENKTDKSSKNHTTITMDHLPQSLISQTASFLTMKEYFKMATVNRTIYIACSNPCSLQILKDFQQYKLTFGIMHQPQPINYRKYRCCKEIQTNIKNIILTDQLNVRDNIGIGFDNLRKLSLHAIWAKDLTDFLGHKININVDHIETLSICRGYDIMSPEFFAFLSHFPNIQYLNLSNLTLNGFIHTNLIQELFPNLKGIKIGSAVQKWFAENLLQSYSTQLECLKIAIPSYNAIVFNKPLPKLNELYIQNVSQQDFDIIQKYALKLRIITIHGFYPDQCFYDCAKCVHVDKDSHRQQRSFVCNLIFRLISEQSNMEYIKIITGHKCCMNLQQKLNGIRDGILRIKNINRNKLQIVIVFDKTDLKKIVWLNIMEHISEITKTLNSSKINDWMFAIILKYQCKCGVLCDYNCKWAQETTRFRIGYPILSYGEDYLVSAYRRDKMIVFVASNNNCAINGYNADGIYINELIPEELKSEM